MISVEEATRRILDGVQPLPGEIVGLAEGLGRVLAEDLAARLSQPWAAVSAMDGYAVRSADVGDTPVRLRVVGEVAAGQRHEAALAPGECVRIFTGAPLPANGDAIVIQEDAERDGDTVVVRERVAPGRYVRPAGLDFATGDVLLHAGEVLTARRIGLAASMNVPWLAARRRPRVALLATGDEIVRPGETVGPSQIVSSNALALAALVRASGGEPTDLGIARDDRASLDHLLTTAAGADLLITTGGASVGEHDLVRQALIDAGLSLDFWRIAMRPGKPLMFGRIAGTPVLGLPGNPVSAVVCGLLFARPLILRMLGVADGPEPPETARLGRDLPANDHRQDYLRSTAARDEAGQMVVTPFDLQDSSVVSRLAAADGLVVRPPNAPPARRGDSVAFLRFPAGPHAI